MASSDQYRGMNHVDVHHNRIQHLYYIYIPIPLQIKKKIKIKLTAFQSGASLLQAQHQVTPEVNYIPASNQQVRTTQQPNHKVPGTSK